MKAVRALCLAGCLVGCLVGAALAPCAATAQDVALDPAYGTVDLPSYSSGDPYTVNLASGGSVDASTLGSPCVGYIANAPDFRVNFAGSSSPLYFSVQSDADTTLVINGPDGTWYCDDDDSVRLNPLLAFNTPASGQYDIWVGTYGSTDLHDAQLSISQRGDLRANQHYQAPDRTQNASRYEYLRSGFTNDPYTVYLSSGGDRDAAEINGCTGFVSAAPNLDFQFDAGKFPLYFRVTSFYDTTLVIYGPDGQWHCDDDSGEEANPLLWFRNPQSGRYLVWIGTYGSTSSRSAELHISELADTD